MDLNQFEIQFNLTTETMEYYCTNGFYSFFPETYYLLFLDLWFERYEFCKFSDISNLFETI
jgi:hypothetical protein